MKIGIMGCGVISKQYIQDIQRLYRELEICMVADVHSDVAEGTAQQYNILRWGTPDELLNDTETELIINLTPPKMHTEVNRKILLAGKHVYCEKPFALTLEEAREIQELARKKGLAVGCAPDTFLGSSLSTCKKLINDGWIGKPLYVNANMMSAGVETWHPRPEAFYEEGGGPLYDMAPYYLSALVKLFGSVRKVYANAKKGFAERTVYTSERFGCKIPVETPTHFAVIIDLKNGMLANMNFSFDISKSTMPHMEIYGTDGTLEAPDPNMTGGVPKVYRREQMLAECFGGQDQNDGGFCTLPELYQDVGNFVRGAGVVDLVHKLDNNKKEDAQLAVHVVDIITSIIKSAETGLPQVLETEYEERQ